MLIFLKKRSSLCDSNYSRFESYTIVDDQIDNNKSMFLSFVKTEQKIDVP